MRKEKGWLTLMLAIIHDDTWIVLDMQHMTPNSKRWDYSDIPNDGHKKIIRFIGPVSYRK